MKGKIVLYILVLLLVLGFNLPFAASQLIDNQNQLFEQSSQVQEELDKLLAEIETTPPAKDKGSGVPTKVVTPVQITQDLLTPDKREKRMDLEFNEANLEDALRIIGDAGDINIVLDPALKGKKVDLHLRNIRIDEALDILYNAYSLGSYQIGSSLYISDKAKIKKEAVITKMIKLKNIDAIEAESLIKALVEVINVSKETNNLVVVGNPEDIAKVEDILKKADVPQPQVLLEAKVVEISTDGLKELGIDWSDSITTLFQETERKPTSTFGTAAEVGSAVFSINKFTRSAIAFSTIIKMLENQNKAKVLSTPRVTTINNKEAEIFVGDRVPYTITTVTGGAASTEVRFIEPGIRLKITPSIIEEDFVVIKIEPEVSYIYGWRGTGDQYPWVKTREATAYVRVMNKQPFILGGLLNKEDKNNLYKVPFIGDVPLLGNLFKWEKTTSMDSELIITVTPTVVSGNF
jgi:type II secretory pathway component GspD/PulD (secretin)